MGERDAPAVEARSSSSAATPVFTSFSAAATLDTRSSRQVDVFNARSFSSRASVVRGAVGGLIARGKLPRRRSGGDNGKRDGSGSADVPPLYIMPIHGLRMSNCPLALICGHASLAGLFVTCVDL